MKQGGAAVARLAHNQKVAGSIPAPATNLTAPVFNPFSRRKLGRGGSCPVVAPILSFARWYVRRLKDMAVFALGFTVGGIYVAVLIESPAVLRAVLALVGS